jgi:sigma-B regulation protein RsbU (phosphoserine phosphatase)
MCTDDAHKILIVDDDPLVLESTSSLIRMCGYETVACRSAQEAMEEYLKGGICLVLSDIKMPGISGVELLGMISDINPDIPVILMTAYAELTIAIDAIRKGAFDFIIKPFNPESLQIAVKKGIRFRQLIELEKNHIAMLEEKVRESEENLKAAAVIQQSLLPLYAPKVASFDFAWQFLPCERVGGDLYNLFWLDETRLGIYVMDVSGHGVPAAMVTTSVAQALDPYRGRLLKRTIDFPPFCELVPPAEVLAELNRDYPIERFNKLLTICYLVLDIRCGKVLYSNAALPLPFLIRADGRVETLIEGGTIIGIGDGAAYEEGEVFMEKDDRLFIYTDGIIEYLDKRGEPYGEKRLVSELKGASGETLQTACARVIQSLMNFGNQQQPQDDITLLGIVAL